MPAFDHLDPSSSGGPTGQVVSARDNLSVVGAGNVIFTDLGQHAGAVPGDVLMLFRERGRGMPRIMLGQAVVLTVETETSTAKILVSSRETHIGDWVEIWR